MKRVPEPELMTGAEQSEAYAKANFEEPHAMFIAQLIERVPITLCHRDILDLGCGPADITVRFAKRFEGCHIDAVDGSGAMLSHARVAVKRADLTDRVDFYQQSLPKLDLPRSHYDLIISNSLLHHLHEPSDLWTTIKSLSHAETQVFIMDLFRPESEQAADMMVQLYASTEPEILQHDFRQSLLAALTPQEINAQLHACDLGHLLIEILSDRHVCIHGKVQNL